MKTKIYYIALPVFIFALILIGSTVSYANSTVSKGLLCRNKLIVNRKGRTLPARRTTNKFRRKISLAPTLARQRVLRRILSRVKRCSRGTLERSPDFVPVDFPGTDYYSFEISSLGSYNLNFTCNQATAEIKREKKGSTNDVLNFLGQGTGGSCIALPERTGFGQVAVQATLGIPTDRRNNPIFDGLTIGQSFAAVEVDVVNSDPLNFVFGAAVPRENGMQVFAQNQNGTFPNTQFYEGVFSVDIVVERGWIDISGTPTEKTTVKSRPSGSQQNFDILVNTLVNTPGNPFPDGLIGSVGASGLGNGGSLFADNMFTFNLQDPTGVAVKEKLSNAIEAEYNALALSRLADSDSAVASIQSSLSDLEDIEDLIAMGGFQSGSDTASALAHVNIARNFDQQALSALMDSKIDEFKTSVYGATASKFQALLFLDGHNAFSGDPLFGTGGIDSADPDLLFKNSREYGELSAWSTGSLIGVSPPFCQEDSNTLCLGTNGRFRVAVEWRDSDDRSGKARVKDRQDDDGTFSFFDPAATDLTAQLLNRCSENNRYWIFLAANTDVGFDLQVTDTQSGTTKLYLNRVGNTFEPITDTSAFATCP